MKPFGAIGVMVLAAAMAASASEAPLAASGGMDLSLFDRKNLVAWCIVPFDAKKRGPEERAAMLDRLGLKRFAYDWRAEHLPRFDEELDVLERHGIELTAVWFPTSLDGDARLILDTLARRKLRTQLWVTGWVKPTASPEEHRAHLVEETARIRAIAQAAAKVGCTVGLYNHGNWFGQPENEVAILKAVNLPNVGLVYNLHHGHEHLDRFPEVLKLIKPYLLAINLNGMVAKGDERGQKILVIGRGDEDARLLRVIAESGWKGPVGILNHTDADAETRLRENLQGLDRLVEQLRGSAAAP